MSIFDKACPQCMSVSPAYVPRCACGHVFDSDSEEDRTLTPEQIARQEFLFEEYLAARSIQAADAAKAARRAANLDPQDARRATEALRAQHAAALAEAELEAQQARARSAAEAAGIDRAALSRTRADTPLLMPVVEDDFLAGAPPPLPSAAAGNRTTFRPRAASARGRRSRPARAEAWKRALTKTVIGAAKTTTIVAKAAKTVVGAAARGATRAVKATQEKRRRSRLPVAANAKPVRPDLSLPAQPPSTNGEDAPTPPASPRVVSDRAAVPQIAAGISTASGARREQAGALLPALPSKPKQSVVPNARFRKVQAQKIAAAVAAARRFDGGSTACECPLCNAELPSTATRCQCGWHVGPAVRDMPALQPVAGEQPSAPSAVVVHQCPQCTATLSTGAARCKCGWRVPTGAAELAPVSLTADERQALSLGLLPPTR